MNKIKRYAASLNVSMVLTISPWLKLKKLKICIFTAKKYYDKCFPLMFEVFFKMAIPYHTGRPLFLRATVCYSIFLKY